MLKTASMAKPTKPPAPKTISLDALSNVTGGRTSAAAPSATATASTSTTSADPNSQMMTLLNQIASSLQNMNQPQNQDPFMRAIMLMQAMRGMGSGGGGPFGGGSPF
jgi:hypothetical protein